MKIEIVVTDKKRGEVRIPISKKEVGDMYDFSFMLSKSTWDCAELNKIDKGVDKVFRKFQHLLHDIIYDGKVFEMKGDKFVLSKKRWYLIKKPNWVDK